MSSLSLSATESLLRITVATPFRVATLPIGSSDAAGVGEGAGVAAGAGVCAGWACANLERPGLASSIVADAELTPVGAGIAGAAAFDRPQISRQSVSQSPFRATPIAPTRLDQDGRQ